MVSILGTRRGLYRQLWPASINRILQSLVSRSHLGVQVPTRLLWGPEFYGMLQCGRRGYYRALPLPFYAPRHQQSSEIGTSIAVCQNLHTRCVTRILLRWGCLIMNWLHSKDIFLWYQAPCGPAFYYFDAGFSYETEGFDGLLVIISARCCLSYSCYCCCCRRSPDVLGISGPAGLLPCRHASRLPDPDFASSPAGSTRGPTPPTPLSHPPPCPHHHHDIDIDIDVDIAGMLLIRGPKIPFTYR